MAKFVKLTLSEDQTPAWFNLELVSLMYVDEGKTTIYVSGDPELVEVTESPEAILSKSTT